MTADAAAELTRSWASLNPLTEFFARTVEANMQAATGAKP